MGLVNRVSAPGQALAEAMELAAQLAAFPQTCLREDRMSVYDQPGLDLAAAMALEWQHGMRSLSSDSLAGAARFTSGEGRHGTFSG
jgi:enoyl-CoA hydratase